MKLRVVYILIFGLGVTGVLAMISAAPSPEALIQGQWEEVAWEYERVNKSDKEPLMYKEISDEVKGLIGQNLVIHKAEKWQFLPNGQLRLTGDGIDKIVEWRIKGRGNILQLKYDDDSTEQYILTELTENKMYLNFDIDIQARGIAKLTFEKTENQNLN